MKVAPQVIEKLDESDALIRESLSTNPNSPTEDFEKVRNLIQQALTILIKYS